MKKFVCLFMICICQLAIGQQVNWKKIRSFQPDDILLAGERKPAKVLLLGTFHFGYPNLDGHKTDSSKYIDVLSPKRQAEMKELAEVIQRFKPTRVYIESSWGSWMDSLYQEYRKGRYKLGRNEIYQVAFRVAGESGLDKIYAVDAMSFTGEYEKKYAWIDSLWDAAKPVDSVRDKYWGEKYSRYYKAEDALQVDLTMLENFLMMAEPSMQQRGHGHYLASGFNTTDDKGPDALSFWWYNRNLRILNKILQTKPTAADRIVILFGNGHMPILRHCFYSSPEFEVVELKSLLR